MTTLEKTTMGIAFLAATTESPIRSPFSVKTGIPSESSLQNRVATAIQILLYSTQGWHAS